MTDLCKVGFRIMINADKAPASLRSEIEKNYDLLDYQDVNGDIVKFFDVDANDADGMDIPAECVEGTYWEDDDIIDEECLSQYIPSACKYLVCTSSTRWDGTSGLKLCKNRLECVEKSYNASLILDESFKSDGSVRCAEYINDVPTGTYTYIIPLTEDEYTSFTSMDFHDVRSFVQGKTVQNETV